MYGGQAMTSVATSRSMTEPTPPAAAAEQPPVAAVPKRKSRPYVILGAVVALGLVGYGVFSWIGKGKESTDDAQVDADVVTVSARVGGTVLKVLVNDNQLVKKGDPLVEIDPADLSVKEKQAEAELAAATAQAAAADAQALIVAATSKGGLSAAQAVLSSTSSSVLSAGAQIDAAKAALSRAQSEASRADIDLARAESLRKDEAIPQAQLDTARTSAQAAHAAVAQAQAQLAASEDARRTAQTQIAEAQGRVTQSAPVDAQLAVAKAQADLAHARADASQAALAEAKLQLSYTHIVAPADGSLSRLAIREGQLVQAGQAVVGLVPNATYVVANFKETQVGRMHAGQRAEISVDALPGRTFEGKIESTSPGTGARFSLLPADNASGNFVKVVQRLPVKITWVNVPPDVKLAAGLSLDVTVFTE
jgi:membrane fusion protein (multidrug efflux system)